MLALSACGGDGETTTVTVRTTAAEATVPPRLPFPLPADGTLPIAEFNAYTNEIDELWERDVIAVVNAFIEAGAMDAARHSVETTPRGEGTSATVRFTLDGLFDDSVRALRYDVEVARGDDRGWELVSATWAQRCHEGRGHQAFSPEPCV
jgi:hypothetical protein